MKATASKRRIRWWLIGLVCYLCGVTSHIVFRFTPITDSMGDAFKTIFQLAWFAAGLPLIAVDLRDATGKGRWFAWALFGIAVLAAWAMVAYAFPDK